jgi:hyperosmotically inducible protein
MRLNKMFVTALVAAGLSLSATASTTGTPSGADADLAAKLGHEIRMYARYSIWDNIAFRVHDGDVELQGQVNQPFKKVDLERVAQHTPGVRSVTNNLRVLPNSFFDDRLRRQVASAIYRDPVLSRYAMQSVPPIHIIVDNGHVTLEGIVNNDMEKNVAAIRAQGAGQSFGQVTNNLQVENPKVKK